MRRLVVLALVALVLVVSACKEKPQPAETQSSGNATQAVPERSKTMNPITPQSTVLSDHPTPVAAPQIEVQLTDYAIRIPETLPAVTGGNR